MAELWLKNVSALEKVFLDSDGTMAAFDRGSALLNEEFAYQILCKLGEDEPCDQPFELEVVSDLADDISLYIVKSIPVYLNHFNGSGDDQYLSHSPGLFPDVLEPYRTCMMVSPKQMKSLWVNVRVGENAAVGVHEIVVRFKRDGVVYGESVFSLDVIGQVLPKLNIPYTNWFHCDCISSYYGVKPLSNKHWKLIDAYLKMAADHGMNMVLTPIFTPPLDTKVGLERPTVQLVEVACENGVYSFGFDRLIRWMELCKKRGIEYLEISHLYSQWGAKHTPKIVVKENGKTIKKFGWHTDALSEEYCSFIEQLLPPLKAVLAEHWDKDKVYFHISDEPNEESIEHYGKLFRFIKPLLGEFKLMDAISEFSLYQKNYTETPVVITYAIKPFLEADLPNLWTYYCCGPDDNGYSNRFLAMPSYRTRIMGLQLFKYDIKGFLHWGYNFYYCRLSTHLINPYLTADSDGGFPAGDAFVVYPANNGPIPSLRLKAFYHGLQDLMAAKLLEQKVGKNTVMQIVEQDGVVTFNEYPKTPEHILSVREAINQRLKELA